MVVELYCEEWSPVQELSLQFKQCAVNSSCLLDVSFQLKFTRMPAVYGACVDMSTLGRVSELTSVKMVRQELLICGHKNWVSCDSNLCRLFRNQLPVVACALMDRCRKMAHAQ